MSIRNGFLIIAIVALVALLATAACAGELLRNGSFEENAVGQSISPAGWTQCEGSHITKGTLGDPYVRTGARSFWETWVWPGSTIPVLFQTYSTGATVRVRGYCRTAFAVQGAMRIRQNKLWTAGSCVYFKGGAWYPNTVEWKHAKTFTDGDTFGIAANKTWSATQPPTATGAAAWQKFDMFVPPAAGINDYAIDLSVQNWMAPNDSSSVVWDDISVSDNLIANGGFEEGTWDTTLGKMKTTWDARVAPDFWKLNTFDNQGNATETTVIHGGAQSYSQNGAGSTKPVIWQSFQSSGVYNLRLHGWSNATGTAYVRIREDGFGPAGNVAYFNGSAWVDNTVSYLDAAGADSFGLVANHTLQITGDGTWKEFDLVVPVMRGTTNYALDLMAASGTARWDDVSVSENLIVNGGFEANTWAEEAAPSGWRANAFNKTVKATGTLAHTGLQALTMAQDWPLGTLPVVSQAFKAGANCQNINVSAFAATYSDAVFRVRENKLGAAGTVRFNNGAAWLPSTVNYQEATAYDQGDALGASADHTYVSSLAPNSPVAYHPVVFSFAPLSGDATYSLDLMARGWADGWTVLSGFDDVCVTAEAVPLPVVTSYEGLKTAKTGQTVDLKSVVVNSVYFGDYASYPFIVGVAFGIESENRVSGSLCYYQWDDSDGGSRIEPGYILDVIGTVVVRNGERGIQVTGGTGVDYGGYPMPIALKNRDTGGRRVGGQVAPLDDAASGRSSVGANSMGLLTTIYGKVTYASPTYPAKIEDGYFYIDDGSGLNDGSGKAGILCRAPANPLGVTVWPAEGQYVSLTGIMGATKVGNATVRKFWSTSCAIIQ